MNETTAREKGHAPLAKAERDIITRQAIGADRYQALCELREYTDRHPVPKEAMRRYDMKNSQLCALSDLAHKTGQITEAILEAFLYGQAKGYRVGHAASKRGLARSRSTDGGPRHEL